MSIGGILIVRLSDTFNTRSELFERCIVTGAPNLPRGVILSYKKGLTASKKKFDDSNLPIVFAELETYVSPD